MPSSFQLTPAEIGQIRKAIREHVRSRSTTVDAILVLKVQTLTAHELIWLTQRMRPADRAFVAWCRR